jgi:hypothetical protein
LLLHGWPLLAMPRQQAIHAQQMQRLSGKASPKGAHAELALPLLLPPAYASRARQAAAVIA